MMKENDLKYKTPVAAFVTLTTQEGYERAINHFETTKDSYGYPIYRKTMYE